MGVTIMQQHKNILIIICDQLSATALSAYGNTYSDTPNLDRLAAGSAVMEYAYTSCPLCQPARASFWTSRYPHQTGVLSNLPDQGFPAVSDGFRRWENCFPVPVMTVYILARLMTMGL